MTDPYMTAIEDLQETASKAADAGEDEARQLGIFQGLSMAKAVYLSMQPHAVDNNG